MLGRRQFILYFISPIMHNLLDSEGHGVGVAPQVRIVDLSDCLRIPRTEETLTQDELLILILQPSTSSHNDVT